MIYRSLILILFIGFGISIVAMENGNRELCLPPKEITGPKNSSYKAPTSPQSLRALCINKLLSRHDVLNAARGVVFGGLHSVEKGLSADMKDDIKPTYYRNNAVELYKIFGELYKPFQEQLLLPFTKTSHDNSYFFEFDDKKIFMYRIKSRGLERLGEQIEGKFIAVTIDSKYLLVQKTDGICVLSLPDLKLVAMLIERYDSERDLLIFEETKGCTILHDAFEIDTYQGFSWGIVYRADYAKLKAINPEAYVSIYGHGIQFKYLLYGKMKEEGGRQLLIFPRGFAFTANHDCALFQYEHPEADYYLHRGKGYTPGDPHEELALCDFRAREKVMLPQLWTIGSLAITPDGRVAASGTGSKITISQLNKLGMEHSFFALKSPTWEDSLSPIIWTQVAISPDGKLVLAVADNRHLVPGGIEEDSYDDFACGITFLYNVANGSSVILSERIPVRHIGFSDNNNFFICTDHNFIIYSMTDFVPEMNELDYTVCDVLLWCESLLNDLASKTDEQVIAEVGDAYSCLKFSIDVLKEPKIKAYLIKHYSLESRNSFFTRFGPRDKKKEKIREKKHSRGCLVS